MNLSRRTILKNTRNGLDIYQHILQIIYNTEVIIDPCAIGSTAYKNPFNQDKATLWIRTDDRSSYHLDIDSGEVQGDVFGFAERYYVLSGDDLLERIHNDIIGFPRFSFYKRPIRSVTPSQTLTIPDVFKLISSQEYKDSTERLRGISDINEAKVFKAANFDYVTFSGTFRSRGEANLLKHSGLIVLDFDHLANVEKVKDQLINDPEIETELLFISPSGDGLKWVVNVEINASEHRECFLGITNYLSATYQLDIDPSGKDVSRACFLPYDPNPYINPKYTEL